MREVRLDYTKCHNTKYISHLDLNRVFCRAVRRANLPLWYTEGFNPKPYFKYVQSLPLGVESMCESVDIRLTDDNYSNAQVKENLNAVLPEGIEILRVHEPKMKASDIYAAVYDLEYETTQPKAAAQAIEGALQGDSLPVKKKVKHGRKKVEEEVDILPNIITFVIHVRENGITLRVLATAQQNNTLNIMLFAKSLEQTAGFEYELCQVKKHCVVNENYRYFK